MNCLDVESHRSYKIAGRRYETSLNGDICTKEMMFVQPLKKRKYCLYMYKERYAEKLYFFLTHSINKNIHALIYLHEHNKGFHV